MFLSLIFSFQNHREYYKNCTTCQPGGLYAPLSVPERRSTPHFHAVFSPSAPSCPIPGVDILAGHGRHDLDTASQRGMFQHSSQLPVHTVSPRTQCGVQ